MSTILQVKGLNKSFGKRQVLKNINFEITKGQIVGLVGPNGAGKTTIMKSLLGLINCQGRITILGQSVTFSSHKILDSVGALIETPAIYPFLSGYNHLKLFAAKNTSKEDINQLVAGLKMTNYIKRKAKTYSLGMKQKLGIALALLNKPRLVILDEPMNGLDPQATKDIRDLFLRLKDQGVTLLISSHILSELQKVADSLLVIDGGKIIQKTTMKKILDKSTKYLLISTNDDTQAKQILQENHYQLASDSQIKIKQNKNVKLADIITLLAKHNLKVEDVKHLGADLESSLLNLLSQDQRKEKA